MKITLPTHPNYKADIDNYIKAKNFVEGDVVNSTYVIPYTTDYTYDANGKIIGRNQHYIDRVRRSYNINLTEATLEQHRTTLSQPMSVTSEDKEDEINNFISDVDGTGITLDNFVRQVLFEYGGLGTCAVLTEAPVISADKSRLSEADQRPYWRLYDAFRVRYWERFEFGPKRGQLSNVILESGLTVDIDGNMRRNFLWYYFDGDSAAYNVRNIQSEAVKDGAFKWVDDGETEYNVLSDQVNPGGLEEIPVVVFGGCHKDSFTWRIWPLNHALLNRLSVLSNINYHHGFPKVFVTGVSDTNELKQAGEYVVNAITNDNAKVLQLQPGDPKAVFEEIRMILHNLKLIAGFKLTQLTADDTRQTQSAEAKSKDLQLLANFYDDTAQYLQAQFTLAMKHVGTFLGVQNPEEITLQIGRDFGLVNDEFDLQADELVIATVSSFFDSETANEVIKAVTTRRIADLRIVGVGDESAENTRQRLSEIIAKATPKVTQRVAVNLSTINDEFNQEV